MSGLPSHHGPNGRFRNPWPSESAGKRGLRDVLRWQLERRLAGLHPIPPSTAFPFGAPDMSASLRAGERARITWIGHSSFVIQVAGHNILTDPVFSTRVSPFLGIGPRRITGTPFDLDALPPIDTVLLSHDHSDHLDEPTIRHLHARYGSALTWVTSLEYRPWLRKRGIERVIELDWWRDTTIGGDASLRIRALPARHWTQRAWNDAFRRLWCSYAIEAGDGTRVYFGGDSGYGPLYREIAEREAPFDAVLLPIGAYDPRWFMAPAHMNPEEAVEAYSDLGGMGLFIPMHWGTFQLADDPPLEPPQRLLAAWRVAGLTDNDLVIPRHGDTVKL